MPRCKFFTWLFNIAELLQNSWHIQTFNSMKCQKEPSNKTKDPSSWYKKTQQNTGLLKHLTCFL